MLEQLLRLPDGRKLRYLLWRVVDKPVGSVVLFHGWPSSADEACMSAGPAAVKAGLNLVSFDRPGVGASSPCPDLSFRSVAGDVAHLMKSLGWTSAFVCGASGGGPYAAACAAMLPKLETGLTVSGLTLIASMTATCGPGSSKLVQGMDWSNRLGYAGINYLPGLTEAALRAGAVLTRHVVMPVVGSLLPTSSPGVAGVMNQEGSSSAEADHARSQAGPAPATSSQQQQEGQGSTQSVKEVGRLSGLLGRLAWAVASQGMAPADRAALAKQDPHRLMSTVSKMLAQALCTPDYGHGLWQDMRLSSQPWTEFDITQISVPTLVFQGDQDVNVTPAMAHHLAHSIPGAKVAGLESTLAAGGAPCGIQGSQAPPGLVIIPGEGHVSLVLNHMDTIMHCMALIVQKDSRPGL